MIPSCPKALNPTANMHQGENAAWCNEMRYLRRCGDCEVVTPVKNHIAPDELTALNASKLPRDTVFAIAGVSRSQLSVARHYGGARVFGRRYVYVPLTDELIRDDVARWLKNYRKKKKVESTVIQGRLF